MEKYTHIAHMEQILVQQEEMLRNMNQLLGSIEQNRDAYRELLNYYYSEQRARDLEDDSAHLIPDEMPRGVLTEDGIFDLVGDYRDTAIRMLETAVQMLKD